MNTFSALNIPAGRGICYSGYREGQQPGLNYPSYDQVKEDLLLLHPHWDYLRLYDCDEHAQTVLDVIENEQLNFKIMLGAYIVAEMNIFNCPWGGGVYEEHQLAQHVLQNQQKMAKLIRMANAYPNSIFSLSVGNESCVDWTDHYVHEDRVLEYVVDVQAKTKQPVTFCENYVPWLYKLQNLAEQLDFISIHTYPVWEYKHIDQALAYTKENYYAVRDKYPHKAVVITEAGWATKANGMGIEKHNVSEAFQRTYFEQLMEWTDKENILTCFFEAFDEDWKGSKDPLEPEKHWGIFKIDRTPKLVANDFFATNLI